MADRGDGQPPPLRAAVPNGRGPAQRADIAVRAQNAVQVSGRRQRSVVVAFFLLLFHLELRGSRGSRGSFFCVDLLPDPAIAPQASDDLLGSLLLQAYGNFPFSVPGSALSDCLQSLLLLR